jgi:hypothetical protein
MMPSPISKSTLRNCQEHRKVEQLTKDFESKTAEEQGQIEALTAGLQKISAQF